MKEQPTPPVSKEEGKTVDGPMYFDGMDDYYKDIHANIHLLVKHKGWKNVYYAILAYQSEEIVSGYKLVDGVSDDYKQLLRLVKQADQQLSSQKAELQECYKILVNAMNLMCESDNERMSDLSTAINEFLHIDPHDPAPCKLML